jgi:hypothetical protein
MKEIVPGILHWTAHHKKLRLEVSSYFVDRGAALIDPMLPEEGVEAFRGREPEVILLTNRHHYRDSERFVEEFGCRVLCHEAGLHEFDGGPRVEGFAFGDDVANGVLALEVGALCAEETAFHVDAGPRALSFGDAILNADSERLEFVPDKLMGDDPEGVKAGLRESFKRLLAHDFDALLIAHGEPLPRGGKAALLRFAAGTGSG